MTRVTYQPTYSIRNCGKFTTKDAGSDSQGHVTGRRPRGDRPFFISGLARAGGLGYATTELTPANRAKTTTGTLPDSYRNTMRDTANSCIILI